MGNFDQQNDPQVLMQLAKNGDSEAFGNIYKLYFTPIYRYIFLRIQKKEETEDLVQVVFLKVYRNINNYQERKVPPLAYFFTVARNTVIDYWRKQKETNNEGTEKIPVELEKSSGNPLQIVQNKEIYKTIRAAIKQLSEEQQEVIILKFINEMRNEEIAKILDKSEQAIRQLQCRALKILRKILKDSEIL